MIEGSLGLRWPRASVEALEFLHSLIFEKPFTGTAHVTTVSLIFFTTEIPDLKQGSRSHCKTIQ